MPFTDINSSPSENNPRLVLVLFAIFFGFLFLGGLGAWIGNMISEMFYGVNMMDIAQQGEGALGFPERQAIRWSNLIAHIFGFTGTALLATILFISPKPGQYLGLNQGIKLSTSLWSILALFVSFPLIQLVIQLNMLLPLPEYLANMGQGQDWLVAEVLHMKTISEFFFVLIVAAVVPAFGEELLFRGLIQKQFQKIFTSPHAAIWVTAILFSAIHLQFAGFFPRMLLGAFLGYLYYWSGSIWLPILIHFLFNGLQVVATYLYPEMINNTAHTVEALALSDVLLGIGSAILLLPLLGKISRPVQP